MHKRILHLLVLLSFLFCLATASHAKHTKTKIEDILLFKQGFLVGYSFQLAAHYPTRMMVGATHQIQWLQCKLPRATILLTPQGNFQIEEASLNRPFTLKFNARGVPSQIGNVILTYDRNGRLSGLGKIKLTYYSTGGIKTFGRTTFRYRNDRKLSFVGKIAVKYRAEGRIKSIGAIGFQYQIDGKIGSIGNLRFVYDPTRHLPLNSSGIEQRAKIRFLWNTLQVNRVLKQR